MNLSFYVSNYSSSSRKLIEKIVLLAGALEKRAIAKYQVSILIVGVKEDDLVFGTR